ncbi:MAG: radical SAM protein [Myxococcales bacterium]|nr:radical SAM protein [Myxococcales bacterium]
MEERTPPPSDGTESPRILRARAEKFGALLATESPTAVIAVDRTLAARLGVDGGALWNDADGSVDVRMYEGPVEVHLAVTAHCPAGCPGCYVDATLGGEHVALDVLRGRLDDIRALGAFRVALGGGEAMLHPDLGAVLAHGRALGLEMSVTTSGLGLTAARAAMLDGASQVNVSHDGLGPDYETVRGYDGSGVAERSIRMLVAAGVRVGVNTVLTRSNFAGVPELAARIRDLGAGELQLLRYKPGGRANLY